MLGQDVVVGGYVLLTLHRISRADSVKVTSPLWAIERFTVSADWVTVRDRLSIRY
jgi:hypothetical protein